MIESPHSRYEPLGLPVYSLYSETRRPTAEMLRGLDCLVIDLQDVGTRVYTFVWTMQQCLIACAAARRPRRRSRSAESARRQRRRRAAARAGLRKLRRRRVDPAAARPDARRIGPAAQRGAADRRDARSRANDRLAARHAVRRHRAAAGSRHRPICRARRPRCSIRARCCSKARTSRKAAGRRMPFEVIGAPFIDPHRLAARAGKRRTAGPRHPPDSLRADLRQVAGPALRRRGPARRRTRRPSARSP